MLTVGDLRRSFIQYFQEREHKIIPSSSLLPKDDPTLLFTTAGMVQFKPMFAGTVDLEYTRAASVQKCLRTSDLENVGKTKRHLTFFEMLGNFSFGDYFKKEAIEYAWEYSTDVIGFPKEDIWISIYQNDDEAYDIWNKGIGVGKDRIVRLGKKDNFWGPAGDSGACGPCSELYIDRGPEYGCGSKDCKPGCECERFLEYWNLVFNQFNQDVSGNLTPLPQTGIDTGMGLERLAALVQNVESVYATDELRAFIDFVCKERNLTYNEKTEAALHALADHSRSLTFAMADGIYPSNDGRGYVLRRILRRALRFSRQLGITEPFVYTMIDRIVDTMKEFYPEIVDSAKNVKSVIESEENRFLETLENGLDRLEETMKGLEKNGEKIISGKDAFILYDTFGFPVEMTFEIAQEKGFEIDKAGYETEMDNQRQRGKQSWKGAGGVTEEVFENLKKTGGDTEFTGYDHEVSKAKVMALYKEDNKETLDTGDEGFLVLDKTPFYGESGGQVGDIGTLTTDSGAVFTVAGTKKIHRTIIHAGSVVKGTFKKGDSVSAEIDIVNRNLIRANHTATHLLQSSLKQVLGNHIKQAGSYVAPDRLRFDFSHFNAMTDEEIHKVEEMVNRKIWESIPVTSEVKNMDDAISDGAIAFFDEKYEDSVRVITVDDFSKELCGGTHVLNTGSIGVFKVLKEASPGAGMRRIEALTLKGVLDRYNSNDAVMSELMEELNVTEKDVVAKLKDLIKKNKALEKEKEKLKKSSLSTGTDSIFENAQEVNGVKIFHHLFDDAGPDQMRDLSDSIRSKEQCSLVAFGSNGNGKPLLMCAATKKAVEKGIDCGKIIKDTSGIIGGGGGGRKDMAQAGGKNPDMLRKALEEAVKIASDMVS